MTSGWKTRALAEVCSISSVLVDPRDKQFQGLLHVGGANIETATGELIDLKTAKEEQLISGKFAFDETMVLYSKIRPYLMKVARPAFGGLCSADIYPLSPNPTLLDRGFLFHQLLSPRFTEFAVSGSARAGMPKVNREHLFTFSISLPPLAEQRRIVGILDEAFAGIAAAKAHAEQNRQNARALFESHLHAVFTHRGPGWVEKTLEDCCEQIFAGGDVPTGRVSATRTSKYSVPIFANGAKDTGLYGYTDEARVVKPSITISARGTIGFAAIRTEPFFPVVRLIVLTPDEKQIRLPILNYALMGMDFGNTGTSIPQLTVPNVTDRKIHVPPLADQPAITARLHALQTETQRLEALYARKLAALGELKAALLHQAFSGQL